MSLYANDKEEDNYQAFMNELEKISKKYGIGISGCGCFKFFDEDGFQKIEYSKDSSSGDIRIKNLIFSDGTKAEL